MTQLKNDSPIDGIWFEQFVQNICKLYPAPKFFNIKSFLVLSLDILHDTTIFTT